ncbi:MAG: hypothetical protein QW775_03500 [Ignisphaera sp.]|uniref:Uncharacterized protein n=1 Tax=Ignisphaera aggregans TaxID=334771 RepID=A0A7C4NLQ1_9CREN
MKSLCAHAETSRGICLEKCCIYLEDFSQIVDIITKAVKVAEMSTECRLNTRIYNRLITLKNLATNTAGRVTSLINVIKYCKFNQDIDASVNTLCNLSNGIVEIRNMVKEILDEPIVATCNTIKTSFENLVQFIDYLGLKTFIIMLVLLNNLNAISSTFSGKIASSFASLLFASLLSIHDNKVKDALKECFTS